MSALRHNASFPGTIEGATNASIWLHNVAARESFPGKLTFALELCLEELFTNVVRHGGAGQWDEIVQAALPNPLQVQVSILTEGDVVFLFIEDNGHPFDVTMAPAKPIKAPLEDVMPGGLGMQLVRSFSKDLSYEAVPGGNRVRLSFDLPQMADAKAAG